MLFRLLGMLIIPVMLFAQEHEVPIGTNGNSLILTIENQTGEDLGNTHIIMQAIPDWLIFEEVYWVLPNIAENQHHDLKINFDVLETYVDRVDTVKYMIIREGIDTFDYHTLILKAVIQTTESGLSAPFPNPSNPGVSIKYTVDKPSHIRIDIFNILGQRVIKLIDEEKETGEFQVNWNGMTGQHIPVAAGTYLVRMVKTTNKTKQTERYTTKIVLLK